MTDNTAISFYVIDPLELYRIGLSNELTRHGFAAAGGEASVEAAVGALRQLAPSLVVVDPVNFGEDIADRVADIRRAAPAARIVAVSSDTTTGAVLQTLRAGVDALFSKSSRADALAQSIRAVAAGGRLVDGAVVDVLIRRNPKGDAIASEVRRDDLTNQEMAILNRLTFGLSNREIATEMGITEATVKVHMRSLLKKMDLANRTQAALWAYREGIGSGAPGAA